MAVKSKKPPPQAADNAPVLLLVENAQGSAFDRTGTALRKGGYQVMHLTAFTAALDVLRSSRRVDLLVAATRMPGQPSGFTLARQAQRLRPALPIIYVASSAEDVASAEASRALGPVLPPDAEPAVLLTAAEQALAGRKPAA